MNETQRPNVTASRDRATPGTARPSRHPNPTARASALSHLAFERPDLDRAEAFLTDFGLRRAARTDDVLYLRGTSTDAYGYRIHRASRARFLGAGFAVETREELERLARLEGASRIHPSPHPGGGEQVTLRDPAGFLVEVVHGRAATSELGTRKPLAWNVGRHRERINATQRPPMQPADVARLGHFVVEVAGFQATCGWYTQHLGLIPSDVLLLPDGSPAVAFLRLDRGEVATDHHTVAIAQGFMPRFGHAAFEVLDADAVGVGQRILRDKGWAHAWGIGRHILGSQIFDYWKDPWGDKHEHYCDGDLFTADQPTGVHAASRESMAQWGAPMPAEFTRPTLSLAALHALVTNLRRSPDLTFAKLVALARLFG